MILEVIQNGPFFPRIWFWQGFNAVRMLKMRLIKGLANAKKSAFPVFLVDKDYLKMKEC